MKTNLLVLGGPIETYIESFRVFMGKMLHLSYSVVVIHNLCLFVCLFLERFAENIPGPLFWKNVSPSSLKDSLDFKDYV